MRHHICTFACNFLQRPISLRHIPAAPSSLPSVSPSVSPSSNVTYNNINFKIIIYSLGFPYLRMILYLLETVSYLVFYLPLPNLEVAAGECLNHQKEDLEVSLTDTNHDFPPVYLRYPARPDELSLPKSPIMDEQYNQ